MLTVFNRLWKDESGQGMVEYGLIIALVAVGVIVAFGPLKTALVNIFNNITGQLEDAVPAAPGF